MTSEIFHLFEKNSLSCRSHLKTVLIEVSEQHAGHPKKRAAAITAEKKYFTQKVQITADSETGEIFSSDFCSGRIHDFKLLRESGTVCSRMSSFLLMLMPDAQGIAKNYRNSGTPFKKKRTARPLNGEEKVSIYSEY